MGICRSAEIEQQDTINRRIEVEFEIAKQAKAIKLLLLGAGASGKSTILKQMIILRANGFAEQEIEQRKVVIRKNMIECMISMIRARKNLKINLDNPELEAKENIVLAGKKLFEAAQAGDQITSTLHLALSQLWADVGVQKCYKRRNEYLLDEYAKYFLDNVDRICSPTYKPTNQDILRSRAKTTGVQEINFETCETVIRVYDVAGQRSERRKWIHLFDIVNSVIFIAALSDYNTMLYEEDDTMNSMTESLNLFETVLSFQWFAEKAMILFLNKKDLFEEKLECFPLNELFPRFEGGANYEHAVAFLTLEFMKRNKSEARQIFTHITCATDTDQVEKVIDSVIDLTIKLNTERSGVE